MDPAKYILMCQCAYYSFGGEILSMFILALILNKSFLFG